ncbi:MAG: discoidin domain-containing protein [Mycobacteriales bacterium]
MPARRRTTVRVGAVGAALAAVAAVAVHGVGVARAAPTNDATCGTAVNGTPAGTTGQAAGSYVLNVGGASEFATVYQPSGDTQAAFPSLVDHDTVAADGSPVRELAARFQLSPDKVSATPRSGQVTSTDGGVSWPSSTYTEAVPAVTGVGRLRDGTLLGYAFKGDAADHFMGYRSIDGGQTWVGEETPFELGAGTATSGRLQSAPLELPDGTILVPYYDGAGRAQVEASTDGGHSFTRRGILADRTDHDAYNESSIAQLPSGRLVSVIRHQHDGDLAIPAEVFSSDNGATWTAPANLSVSFPYGYDPIDDNTKALIGVAPDLKLMPNGVLVLRSGRPDNWVAISSNGQGTGWIGQLTYRNCPSVGDRTHGSTGYGGIDYLGDNRAVVVGDNCEMTWACVLASETNFTIDKHPRVWRRWIDVLTPDVGRIDLATKYRKGEITVGGDMTTAVAGHPRAGVGGAFDGSTEYWSSAVHAGGPGTFVLNLDRTYPLTKIGLSLRNGRPASGRVYTSMDGTNWGDPVATISDHTDLAMEYFTLSTPVSARYVKVELDATGDCDSGLGATCAFLNEMELYSAIDSFENDPVNNRPRGFTTITTSWVSQRTGDLADNDSTSALRIIDNNTGAQSQVTWPGTATATKTLEFRLKAVSLLGFLFDLKGTTSAGATTTAYHLAVGKDGDIRRHDGSSWITVAPAGTIAEGKWYTIRVTATTTSASIAVNGTTVATGIPATAATSALTGYTMASNGTGSSGDNYLVDDILLTR